MGWGASREGVQVGWDEMGSIQGRCSAGWGASREGARLDGVIQGKVLGWDGVRSIQGWGEEHPGKVLRGS